MTDLRFEAQWLTRDHGSPAERAAFGALRITAGATTLTELYDDLAMTLRGEARLSLLHFGTWLIANWWRLRWEPTDQQRAVGWRLSHDLPAAGGGFEWPPLRFESDGEHIRITTTKRPRSGGRIRYTFGGEVVIAARAWERSIDALMQVVSSRLIARAAPDDTFGALLSTLAAERSRADTSALRRREALMGLDPGELPADQLEAALASGAWMGDEAWDEVITATQPEDLNVRAALLEQWSLAPSPTVDLGSLVRMARNSPRHPGELAWQRGGALARHVRVQAGLGLEPLPNSRLQTLIGIAPDRAASVPADFALAVGVRDSTEPERLRIRLRRTHRRSRRFELARLAGDVCMHPSDLVLPVTDRDTYRQKAQRAFAQELLCPTALLAQRFTDLAPSDDDIADVAHEYEVSELVVQHALVNGGLVARDYFARADP